MWGGGGGGGHHQSITCPGKDRRVRGCVCVCLCVEEALHQRARWEMSQALREWEVISCVCVEEALHEWPVEWPVEWPAEWPVEWPVEWPMEWHVADPRREVVYIWHI